jgi:hypothetical protein
MIVPLLLTPLLPQLKVSVARSCRAVEVAGLALSLASLLLSLCVFNFVKLVRWNIEIKYIVI